VRQFFRRKSFVAAAALALLAALYAFAGFVLAPRLLRSELIQNVQKTLSLTPTVGEIRINPFKLQLEVNNFALPDRSGAPLLGFDRLFVKFEYSSIWHRALVFQEIDIDAPVVNASVARDGEINLLQLRPNATPAKARDKPGPLPAIRIGSLRVANGQLGYEDHSRPTAFAERLQPINFELLNFTTGVEGGRFSFTGTSKLGERVEWHGRVSLQPVESDGEIRIGALRARTLWEYLEDQLAFSVNSGSIDVSAAYRFSLKDELALQVDVSTLAVTELGIAPKGSDVNWITIPQMTLSGATADLSARRAQVDSVSITGMKLIAWLEPDASLNLMKLAAPSASAPAAAPASPATATEPWRFDLRQFELQDASVSVEDRSTTPVAKVLLAPLSLQVSGASLDLSKPVKVAFDTRIDTAGSLAVSGEVWPQPAAADLSIKLAGIGLAAAQPYLAQYTSMTLLDGRLGGALKLHYGSGKPALRLSGDIRVEKFHTVDNALREDFVNGERLELAGLDFQHAPDRLDIAQVVVQKPYARVIIEPDASMNVKRVLTGPGPAAPHAAQSASAPMPMAIGKIIVKSGQANFADLSVKPNFAAGIQALEGTILGVSSKAQSRAKVDLHGSVGPYSPVSITGDVNVLGAPLYVDMAMDFRNMELSTFNPYSGKFAGYNITKGKLTTELHYKVNDRKLDAQHHIVVDQLEFGDKTDSKDAVSLPVKLAVALLKDRNGVIDLNLPVTGSLDDPKFRLGPLVWKVLVNLLEKAVTAPFALLGSLFGGGPDTQFIDFQPGAALPDAAAMDKLKVVARALSERPQLKIELPIATVAELDAAALLDARFQQRLRAAAAPAGVDQLSPAARLDLLAKLYAKDLGGAPKYPDEVTGLKDKTALTAAKIDYLSQELRQRMAIGDEDLKALGEQRAMALQQVLLSDTQIDPARVFLVANGKANIQNGAVRVEMTLQ
jgi:Domain of Unknown Function (DUF748)